MHYDGVCFFGDKRGQAPPHLSLRSESTSRETREKEKKNGHLFSSILQGVCLSGMLLRITNLRQEDSAGNKKKKLSRNNIKSRVDLNFREVWNTKQISANDLTRPEAMAVQSAFVRCQSGEQICLRKSVAFLSHSLKEKGLFLSCFWSVQSVTNGCGIVTRDSSHMSTVKEAESMLERAFSFFPFILHDPLTFMDGSSLSLVNSLINTFTDTLTVSFINHPGSPQPSHIGNQD